jgi:ATP-binding cassette subfamily B protein
MQSADFSPPGNAARGDWRVVRMLFPYLWEFRWRVAIALTFLVAAKLANVTVPLVMCAMLFSCA